MGSRAKEIHANEKADTLNTKKSFKLIPDSEPVLGTTKTQKHADLTCWMNGQHWSYWDRVLKQSHDNPADFSHQNR